MTEQQKPTPEEIKQANTDAHLAKMARKGFAKSKKEADNKKGIEHTTVTATNNKGEPLL